MMAWELYLEGIEHLMHYIWLTSVFLVLLFEGGKSFVTSFGCVFQVQCSQTY